MEKPILRRSDTGGLVQTLSPLTRPGGEGQVFHIDGSTNLVAKIYHRPPDPSKAAKIRHQLTAANPALKTIAAWPTALLLDIANPTVVRGILMPRMPGKEIHRLYGPNDRCTDYPKAGWDFLVHVAMNCAAAFETLHSNRIVMADVNEGNLLVNENDGRVALIDCDSYQIEAGGTRFGCDVGIPMWTPPELQGADFRGLVRTANHDRFGLAVLIFRLLFMGRHPFSGIPTGLDQFEIEQAIKRHLFAFSSRVWSQGVRQPPHTLSMSSVPEGVRRLFDRAFLPGSEQPNARPTGREWAGELRTLLNTLKGLCLDPGHKCWNRLTDCPWCAIANAGGPNFFVSVAIHLDSPHWVAEFNASWATIQRIFNGALMQETASLPALAQPQGRPMTANRPQPPSGGPPTPPPPLVPMSKFTPPTPIIPSRPTLRAISRIASIPMGHQERMARYCNRSAIFFAAFTLVCWYIEARMAMYGASWVSIVCLLLGSFKRHVARQERQERQEAENRARCAERRDAEKEYAEALAAYEIEVVREEQAHRQRVACAEAEYQQSWLSRDQEYQAEFNAYLSRMRDYQSKQRSYDEELALWNAEASVRRLLEEDLRRSAEAKRGELESALTQYKSKVQASWQPMEAARQRFEKSRTDELNDMRGLHQKRREVQLHQFLKQQLIHDADIPGVGAARKATLAAYNVCTAFDIHGGIQVPGIGDVTLSSLQDWRRLTEARFHFNAATPLPTSEVNTVKVKHGQTRQSALAALKTGAASLEALHSSAQSEVERLKRELLNLTREHAQAMADLAVCS